MHEDINDPEATVEHIDLIHLTIVQSSLVSHRGVPQQNKLTLIAVKD